MRIELWIYAVLIVGVAGDCSLPSPITVQLILDYAKYRDWDQLVIYDTANPVNCSMDYARAVFSSFWDEGISLSFQTVAKMRLPEALRISKARVAAVVMLDNINLTSTESILHVASQNFLFNYYISWFLISENKTDSSIDRVLRHLNIGLDSDVIVATTLLSSSEIVNYTRRYVKNLLPTLRNYSHTYRRKPSLNLTVKEPNVTHNLNYSSKPNQTMSFAFVHVYKIRINDNTSLVTDEMGFWNPDLPRDTELFKSTLKQPPGVKTRANFRNYTLFVGTLNSTSDEEIGQDPDDQSEDSIGQMVPLYDLIKYIARNLHASLDYRSLPLGSLGDLNKGESAGLLVSVKSGELDIGLGYIADTYGRSQELSFSNPLIRYTRNVYFHPPEYGFMRDIFLQPFSNHLLFSVAMTYFLIVITVGVINYAADKISKYEVDKKTGLGEAALCCFSIMCMQGSPWIPQSRSGRIVLFTTLMFALIIYNAYSGFITSILSVQATGIRSINDLLSHNFKLGFSGTDKDFISTNNDINLKTFYINAFIHDNVNGVNIMDGLHKAINGSYAFFASGTLVRKALRTKLIKNRCSLKELPITQTFTKVALPMAKTCPYRKIINLNILRVQERGILHKIQESMLPEMPRCSTAKTFNSARLEDVYSAFLILIAGGICSAVIGVLERIWAKRRMVKRHLVHSIKYPHHRNAPMSTGNIGRKTIDGFLLHNPTVELTGLRVRRSSFKRQSSPFKFKNSRIDELDKESTTTLTSGWKVGLPRNPKTVRWNDTKKLAGIKVTTQHNNQLLSHIIPFQQ